MAKNKLSPHDRFTRSAMSNPQVAEEFFQQNLPEHIKKIMDFSSLELQKESFIDDKLKLHLVDLLYSVNFKRKPGFLYILFEHASTPQLLLPFRILKYMISIMDHHLNSKKTNKLPLVYPIILYNGQTPYKYSMDLFDLFPTEERVLAKETLTAPYHLIDLTQISDEELKKYLWCGTMARTLKHIHDPNILLFLREILHSVKELEKYGAESYIYTIVTYIAETGAIPHQKDWVETIQELESIEKETLMTFITLAEYLQPDVFKRGIEKGMEKGRQEGRQEEKIEIAKTLLVQGINLETIAMATALSQKDLKKLLS